MEVVHLDEVCPDTTGNFPLLYLSSVIMKFLVDLRLWDLDFTIYEPRPW